ncbi:MAG: MBL fold metallo-hydrolase [Fusobacteriota bacterium]
MLGTGSSGNATFIETDGYRFLIDAGFSGKKTKNKLKNIGVDINTLSAIVITHEHGDHVKGAGVLSRRYNLPIHIGKKSYKKVAKKLGKLKRENIQYIEKDFNLGGTIKVSPFEVLHDSVQTFGFRVQNKSGKVLSLATDIGYITNIVKQNFKKSNLIIIESNYDYQMLMKGPYPWHLKNRVKSKTGHLSNDETAKFIKKIYSDDLQKAFLAHVSSDNNEYDLVEKVSRGYLEKNNIDLDVEVVTQENTTEIFHIK